MPDKIDEAINGGKPAQMQHRLVVQHVLPTGRGVALDLPADLNVGELLALITFVAAQLPAEIVKASGGEVPEARSGSGLIVPRLALPRH